MVAHPAVFACACALRCVHRTAFRANRPTLCNVVITHQYVYVCGVCACVHACLQSLVYWGQLLLYITCLAQTLRYLKKIQNKCLRIITKAHSRTHRRVLRNLTHIPSLASRHTYLYLCEFYKLYKNISPKLLNDMLIVNT